LLGDMLGELKDRGIFDDSLVVVAADHGISFEADTSARKLRDGSPEGLDGLAYAPLLIKAPGQTTGSIDDSSVMSIDVVPTIADALGIDLPFDTQGFAAGSEELAARGDERFFFDLEGPMGSEKDLRGIVRFDGAQYFPSAADRRIGPITDRADPTAGLYARLAMPDVLGRPFDEFGVRSGGQAELQPLADLRSGSKRLPPGIVTGRVTSPTTNGSASGDTVVLAVNGTIVAASPLFDLQGEPNTFVMLLPPGVLTRDNEIRAALLTSDGAIELTLSG
jgi:hypothetical protein